MIIGNDVLGEYYINQVLESIRSDVFIRTRFLNQVLAQSNIKLRILTSLPYYLDKYEVAVYTYDRLGAPYGSTEASDLDYWIHQFAIPGYETGYQGVYFQKATTGRSKYIAITPIDFYGNTIGHIVIELTQKKFTSTSVFPSLLVENSPTSSTLTFDYLIYKDDQLVYSYGGDPDMIRLEAEDRIKILQVTNGKEIDGRHLMAFKMDDGNILFVSSPVYPWSFILANISFYFLIAVIAISIVYVILRFFFHVGSFSLGNKIQLYIGVSFIVPMMIITIVLLEVLKQTYSDEIAQNFEKRAKTIAENLVSEVESFINNRVNRDQFFYELSKAADYTQTDMIIYHLNGKLLGTNRGEVFNWNLMSRQINPQALHYIQSGNGQLIVLNERIGNLDFKTVYTGIYGIEDGNLMAIISLPFFDFKNQLQKQQLEIFHDLMILIAIVFIITMVVGQVNLKRIIMPIKTIAHRLNKINYLQEQTPFLEYSSQDEIGLLVSEFNSMVLKLEASKQELLKIQKETAWKEIARQVAHEIKNPLTPMRLKIQQLMRHFEPDTRQYRSLESLLTQVDSLASIADSFSAFAKMPAPENHLFNLSKVIAQSASLFQSENVTMHLAIQEGVMVNTDQKMLSQILNNLILNAIQSKVDSLHVIHIGLTTQSDKAIITVEDDGDGIPMEHQDKIFKPYFSTKETGSGIGLALAKKGIEQANGAIWFDSEAGKGTKFYISLPIA